MRVRKLDVNGDYSFGHGEADFWINSPYGVAQKVETRLRLWQGEWFLDVTIGTPWLQKILGYGKSALRDIAIRTVILQTDGVTALNNYNSIAVPGTRNLIVSGSIFTQYSKTPINFGPVTL